MGDYLDSSISVTFENDPGGSYIASSGSFDWAMYLSTDSTITSSDTQVGYDQSRSSINGGSTGTDSLSSSNRIPSTLNPGNYYWGFIVDIDDDVSESNENIKSFPLDVTDRSKCKEVFEQIRSHYGDVDICFFSTGTWNPKKEKDIDVEQMEDVFRVNFFGTVNAIKAVEEYFKNKKSGIITIVSSIAGYRGLPNSTGYGPSKSALNNLAAVSYTHLRAHETREAGGSRLGGL